MKTFRLFPLILLICLVFSCLSPAAFALEDPVLNGKAALVVDLDTGDILYELNKDQVRAPASLTKIMTTFIALEAIDTGRIALTDIVTAQADCLTGMSEDSSTAGITPGMQLSVKDLLYCTMLHSANEACNILGTHISGSISGFVDEMNAKAAQLGCSNTHFMNPNGLPAENHYSSAYDLYLITEAAMKYPMFMELANTLSYTCDNPDIAPFSNSNALITDDAYYARNGSYKYEGAAGIKTGYTNAAGYCLISTAERNDIHVMAIAMGCDGELNVQSDKYWNFDDSIAMYDWVFNNFSRQSVLSTAEDIRSIPVELGVEDSVIIRPANSISSLLPNELTAEQITREVVVYSETVTAPVAAGTALGEMRLSYNGKDLGAVKLVTANNVELSRSEYIKMRILEIVSRPWVVAVAALVLLFLLIYLILLMRYRALRREHMRQRQRMERRRQQERERMYAERERSSQSQHIQRESRYYQDDESYYDRRR